MELVHDTDGRAIPLRNVQEVLDTLAYASVERVMFRMLYLTGCRIAELDRMTVDMIYDGFLYWPLGKNQRKYRKEKLPHDYVEELRVYRETHSTTGKRLFGIKATTFRRYFNRDVRPRLSDAWHKRRLVATRRGMNTEYFLQLKGLRKTFQTMTFVNEWQKWDDAGVALEFTSKRMKHSSKGITVHHYLENFDNLGVRKIGKGIQPISDYRQTRLLDY